MPIHTHRVWQKPHLSIGNVRETLTHPYFLFLSVLFSSFHCDTYIHRRDWNFIITKQRSVLTTSWPGEAMLCPFSADPGSVLQFNHQCSRLWRSLNLGEMSSQNCAVLKFMASKLLWFRLLDFTYIQFCAFDIIHLLLVHYPSSFSLLSCLVPLKDWWQFISGNLMSLRDTIHKYFPESVQPTLFQWHMVSAWLDEKWYWKE